MNQTDVDVSHLVDAAFKEARCDSVRKDLPHDGDIAGVAIGHECTYQLLCHSHLRRYIEANLPEYRRKIETFGYVTCEKCDRSFSSVDSFARVVVL